MENSTTDIQLPRQDLEGWRLVVGQDSHGQHKWVYLAEVDPRSESCVQSKEDKYWLGMEIVSVECVISRLPYRFDLSVHQDAEQVPRATTPLEAARNGFNFYKQIQSHDGYWAGAYGGTPFDVNFHARRIRHLIRAQSQAPFSCSQGLLSQRA